ncbi:MAG: hypothetical protein LBT46_00235 [Planctomycetaceae bacterium]|jgi:proteic killer suppression protein|nr:hypothetical protein [Planctomycetaceae bacterium]
MKVSYANIEIQKICTNPKALKKALGNNAKFLQKRLDQLDEAANLELLRNVAGNFHELTSDRKGQLACSITGKLRLIFTPDHIPLPTKPDGGLNWAKVTAVTNIEIVDYH